MQDLETSSASISFPDMNSLFAPFLGIFTNEDKMQLSVL